MDEFLQILGEDKNDILTYCLGEDWSFFPVRESHIFFNEKLGTNIKRTDLLLESAHEIKSAWISHKRNLTLKEILE